MVLFAPLSTAQDDGATGRTAFLRTRERARAAHQVGMDALLIDDRQSMGDPAGSTMYEAGTIAAALAVASEGIGLVTAIATEQLAPYHVARAVATVDHLSGGRAGWEVRSASDDNEVANYRRGPATDPAQRSARAAEFIRVVTGLWDSFDDDAFDRDRASGSYFVPERLHALDHEGEYFDVAGPLNIARPPQGHPVLVHRLTGPTSQTLAGRLADVLIVPTDSARDVAEIRQGVRASASGADRAPEDVLILLEWRVRDEDRPDHLSDLVEAGAVDGFALLPPRGPIEASEDAMLRLAADLRRNVSRSPEPGQTLRARLGLPRPADRRTVV
ncbi:LLM class flavin-dependent oxidoreductase [Saccharopolyspora phatthalungensis]|uniref:Alkanesulfonate monooxygenase SsuD/methylene tetrahydromethanopterin reductase-like flavin-dependent oxidoreductase (Luciferase family) n=1 Tax=Saccharopolyspora phatthalungensis TaxID=664693 RepID=A0A840QIW4_9PSEU|nr:LLM class flavin-dependent oxidoreductase [Saccharopolyspora phatthalungensis]MBB5158729.1 alkanesulfonate monooxygenase SsuD/methylene tetrahydromethanopterin reductase-like flavin-dependent oxidoreductase (luciferase family) [Saccharopolyspora phatthalungensis]